MFFLICVFSCMLLLLLLLSDWIVGAKVSNCDYDGD